MRFSYIKGEGRIEGSGFRNEITPTISYFVSPVKKKKSANWFFEASPS
jgi:hypothetical protein